MLSVLWGDGGTKEMSVALGRRPEEKAGEVPVPGVFPKPLLEVFLGSEAPAEVTLAPQPGPLAPLQGHLPDPGCGASHPLVFVAPTAASSPGRGLPPSLFHLFFAFSPAP